MNSQVYNASIPDLLEAQRASFFWFLTEGIAEELAKFPTVFELPKNVELRVYTKEYCITAPNLSELEAQKKDKTYGVKLYLPVKITDFNFLKDVDETKNEGENIQGQIENVKINPKLNNTNLNPQNFFPDEKDANKQINFEKFIDLFQKEKLYLGEIPLMTNNACFIYNGYKRIILHQIVRSPGLYFKVETKTTSVTNKNSNTYIATILPNYGSWLSFELEEVFEENENSLMEEKNLLWVRIDKVYKIPIHWFLTALKLTKEEILGGLKNFKQIKTILFTIKEELEELRENDLKRLYKSSNYKKKISSFERNDIESEEIAILEIQELIASRLLNPKYYDLGKIGRIKLNKKLGLNTSLTTGILTVQDILKIIDNLLDFKSSNRKPDDIDSLENRRVRCVGELLQIQLRLSLSRIERKIEQKIKRGEATKLAYSWINSKPLISIMREFFGSSQLSQFMDEINPLSEMTHKRRVSSLGPGGLSSDHVSFVARDIHPTQYGRLCPIETSEGENAGLIASLATYAQLDENGFLKTPFFPVEYGKILYDADLLYLTAEEEGLYKIAAADTKLNEKNILQGELIPVRYQHEFTLAPANEVNFISVSPIQMLSAAASLIPFLEHDDANRALMGSNMQRQALPLLRPQQPIVGTGLERQIAGDSRNAIINRNKGKITYVSAEKIEVYSGTDTEVYFLQKYLRSNQDTCINQKPIVWVGEVVEVGQVLADGAAMVQGELALGQNLIVAYMAWEGYNYEDAILISERLVYEDLFTSIHIERYDIEIEQTKVGPEEVTRDVPEVSAYRLRNLDEDGLVSIGSMVEAHDILVGKVAPKEDLAETPEVKLLNAIFGTKTPTVYDTSLKVPLGIRGRIVELSFSSEEKDFSAGTVINVFIAQMRKIQIGDKMAGRHGNKGVISKILPFQDMPYLPDGTVVDIILNPLGVPSRMNVGQIFESLLGLAGDQLEQRFTILPFDERYGVETSRILINEKLKEASEKTNKAWLFNEDNLGKIPLTDGRTGELFDNPVFIGKAYIIKLIHLVDDKIHARSTGPYSLVSQQPLGGKSHHGGQRFGEMEVWALEAYGAAYTLQELLTIKSDDLSGRNEMFSSLVRGKVLPKPGIPESFNVLLSELRALGIDLKTYLVNKAEGGITQSMEVDLMAIKIRSRKDDLPNLESVKNKNNLKLKAEGYKKRSKLFNENVKLKSNKKFTDIKKIFDKNKIKTSKKKSKILEKVKF